MTAALLASHADASVFHCDWRALLDIVREYGGCDALIVDAPYSERTHSGHSTAERYGTITPPAYDDANRREINYAAWTDDDVCAFVDAWAPLVRDWIVSITDEDLRASWRGAMECNGLQTFARVPAIETGATVRFAGDGPANWTTDVVVARTREKRHIGAWKPSAYYCVPREAKDVIGGKSLRLMEQIVRDYSRPGGLVVDPCCGAGTTLVAAQRTGRRAIGGDAMLEHAQLAAKRISRPAQVPMFGGAL